MVTVTLPVSYLTIIAKIQAVPLRSWAKGLAPGICEARAEVGASGKRPAATCTPDLPQAASGVVTSGSPVSSHVEWGDSTPF